VTRGPQGARGGVDPIRVLIADDHALFRRALELVLKQDPGIELVGTAFQRRVWNALLTIPYGQTRSYGDIARQIGSPGAFRAVGLANGHNPIGIIVPCHRVIGSNGSLTGYGGGLDRKRALLDLEKQQVSLTPTLFD